MTGPPFDHPLTLVWAAMPTPEEARDRLLEFAGVREREAVAEILMNAVAQMKPPHIADMLNRAAKGSLDVSLSFNSSIIRGLQYTFQVVLRP